MQTRSFHAGLLSLLLAVLIVLVHVERGTISQDSHFFSMMRTNDALHRIDAGKKSKANGLLLATCPRRPAIAA